MEIKTNIINDINQTIQKIETEHKKLIEKLKFLDKEQEKLI